MKQHSQTFKSRFYFPNYFKVDEIITKKIMLAILYFCDFKQKKRDRGYTLYTVSTFGN